MKTLVFYLPFILSEEYWSCNQQKFDAYCVSESTCGFSHARFNRDKFKWRCYQELDADDIQTKECATDQVTNRAYCRRHGVDSQYCNIHSAALAMFEEDCHVPGRN